MSLRRRLHNLEIRARLPIPRSDAAMGRTFQRKLCLPLPDQATDSERAACLRLMQDAQHRLRANREDTGGLDAIREFALRLHSKYGTDPLWGGA